MRTRLVRIGNSRGVRIPKPLIEEAGLGDEVELKVREGAVVVLSLAEPRAGWSEAARIMRSRGDDRPSDADTPTAFDRKEWRWR